jgi:hypothetical protein
MSLCIVPFSALAGGTGRPFGTVCITGAPLVGLPFTFATSPFDSFAAGPLPGRSPSADERTGKLNGEWACPSNCVEFALLSPAKVGIIHAASSRELYCGEISLQASAGPGSASLLILGGAVLIYKWASGD